MFSNSLIKMFCMSLKCVTILYVKWDTTVNKLTWKQTV